MKVIIEKIYWWEKAKRAKGGLCIETYNGINRFFKIKTLKNNSLSFVLMEPRYNRYHIHKLNSEFDNARFRNETLLKRNDYLPENCSKTLWEDIDENVTMYLLKHS